MCVSELLTDKIGLSFHSKLWTTFPRVYEWMRPRETAKFVWNQLTKANQKTHAADDFRQDLHFTYPPVCKCMMIHWLYTIYMGTVVFSQDWSQSTLLSLYVLYIHFFFENRARSDEGKGGWIPEKNADQGLQ